MKKYLTGLLIIFFGIGAVITPLSLIPGDISQNKLLNSNESPQKEDPNKNNKNIIKAYVDFNPNTLNCKSKGKWVTVSIHFSNENDITNVQLDSLLFNNELIAEKIVVEIGEGDDFDKLVVKFDRSSVISFLGSADVVEIVISGKFNDGAKFEGKDSIRLINF